MTEILLVEGTMWWPDAVQREYLREDVAAEHQIFLLTPYGKGEKEDLTAQDLKRVVKLLEELKGD